MEFDGGLPREGAESLALEDVARMSAFTEGEGPAAGNGRRVPKSMFTRMPPRPGWE